MRTTAIATDAKTVRAQNATSFGELGLTPVLSAALTARGVTVPFPIQAATLPSSLAGRDVLGRGRTGSGKTLPFGLAVLARIAGRLARPRQPLGLVLVPTRELAQQVADALTPYARVVGLRNGAEVVVATPGRLLDLVGRGGCLLDQVEVAVLDEADQMADMGFLPQVTALLTQVRPDGQRVLLSATLDRDVDRLVRRFLTDPVVHHVDPPAGAVRTMEHHLLRVTADDKSAATVPIAAREGRVLLFPDSKRAVDRLTRSLLAHGVRAAALHGGRSQPQRTRALGRFKGGEITALVATNVAARGIHIDDLDLVVKVDPPSEAGDYVYRSGRTARAGAAGSVVTLVLPDQIRAVDKLMAAAGVTASGATVHSSGAELARITGARTPSGVPVLIAAPVTATRPERRGARGSKPLRYGAKAPNFPSGRTAPTTPTSRRRNAT